MTDVFSNTQIPLPLNVPEDSGNTEWVYTALDACLLYTSDAADE